MCIYIYIYTYHIAARWQTSSRVGGSPGAEVIPVSVKKALLRRRGPLGKIGLQKATSGANTQFFPLGCMAKARTKGLFFHRHR